MDVPNVDLIYRKLFPLARAFDSNAVLVADSFNWRTIGWDQMPYIIYILFVQKLRGYSKTILKF